MLKQDKPLFVALLAVAFSLALNAMVSFAQAPNSNHDKKSDETPANKPEWLWGAAEALATITIAGLAVFQWRDSRKSSERQLRAYLLAETVNIEQVHVGTRPTFRVKIRNFGQTPAYFVRAGITTGICPIANAGPFPPFSFEGSATRTIGPGDFFYMDVMHDYKLSQAQAGEILAKRMSIFVIGKLEYRDAFDTVRRTDFCFYLAIGIAGSDAMTAYHIGNVST